MARTLEHYNTKGNYQNITVKVFMILPALFKNLQKLVRLKKDHSNKLEIRFQLWKDGNILDLLPKGRTIQERVRNSKSENKRDEAKIFSNLMMHRKINAAVSTYSTPK